MLVQMELSRILIHERKAEQLIELRELDPNLQSPRSFPIVIGIVEAAAIGRRLEGMELPRPMTHDLMKNLISNMAGEINHILVSELKDNTFYAVINMVSNGATLNIDSRPSDAIALALRVQVPIYVNETVIEAAKSLDLPDTSHHNTEEKDQWSKWIDNIKPQDFGNL